MMVQEKIPHRTDIAIILVVAQIESGREHAVGEKMIPSLPMLRPAVKGPRDFHNPYLNAEGAGDGEGPLFYFRCVSRSAHLIVAEAVGSVVVYQAGGLHQGVADGAANELEATAAELFAEGVRLGRCGRDLVH